MSNLLRPLLANPDWLSENEDAIKKLLPDTWTHMENMSLLKLGFGFKLLGLEWRDERELISLLVFFENITFMQRQNGYQVRANPGRVFPRKPQPTN